MQSGPHVLVALVALFAASGLCAQSCSPGDILLKNDSLPAVPTGLTGVGVVRGLCDGEAAMAVFTTAGPVDVRKVSVMYGSIFGPNALVAALDVALHPRPPANAP